MTVKNTIMTVQMRERTVSKEHLKTNAEETLGAVTSGRVTGEVVNKNSTEATDAHYT